MMVLLMSMPLIQLLLLLLLPPGHADVVKSVSISACRSLAACSQKREA